MNQVRESSSCAEAILPDRTTVLPLSVDHKHRSQSDADGKVLDLDRRRGRTGRPELVKSGGFEVDHRPAQVSRPHPFDRIIGDSAGLRRALGEVEKVAPTDSTVLIRGETGTGKELIAQAIHELSARCDRPFVKLNCAAIPAGLLESELFGHERGAFTGAVTQRIGRFELANRGTLFLDEIGDIPLELQPKLLRVLQEQEFERLGSSRTTRVDVRLVAATNRDLEQMLPGTFRADLYYRLNVFPIALPPLRERPEDILPLVHHLMRGVAHRMNKPIETISPETIAALREHAWPGNIRELENAVERAVVLASGPILEIPVSDFRPRPRPLDRSSGLTLEEIERDAILRALRETNWIVGGPRGAAAQLGLKRTTLQARMMKLGIERTGASVGGAMS